MNARITSRDELVQVCQRVRDERQQHADQGIVPIRICMGASCIASGARDVKQELVEQIASEELSDKVEVCEVGCLGPCSGGPVVVVETYSTNMFELKIVAPLPVNIWAKGEL
jgi:NADH:ubiquinone oxidoreductase subunit E